MRPKLTKISLNAWKLISSGRFSFDLLLASLFKAHKKCFLLIPNYMRLYLSGDEKLKSKVLPAAKIYKNSLLF